MVTTMAPPPTPNRRRRRPRWRRWRYRLLGVAAACVAYILSQAILYAQRHHQNVPLLLVAAIVLAFMLFSAGVVGYDLHDRR